MILTWPLGFPTAYLCSTLSPNADPSGTLISYWVFWVLGLPVVSSEWKTRQGRGSWVVRCTGVLPPLSALLCSCLWLLFGDWFEISANLTQWSSSSCFFRPSGAAPASPAGVLTLPTPLHRGSSLKSLQNPSRSYLLSLLGSWQIKGVCFNSMAGEI